MTDLPTLAQSPLTKDAYPMGLQIMFNDDLYERCQSVAKVLAQSQGFVPKHLEGATYACFAVVIRALTWRLDPFSVAASTYQTPGGTVGYEGKLIHAVLNSSGRFEGDIKFEHYGDWDKIENKFELKKSRNGNDYHAPAWKPEDEIGVGVEVIGQVKGEAEPRTFRFDLKTAYPRNSTLWALRPKQQICYTAVRAFANLCAPEILMGTNFDFDDPDAGMVDITPARPQRNTEALPEDIEQLGREDRQAGRPFRQHPDHLTNEQVEHWRKGWQDADRAYHEGNQDPDAPPAETKQIEEPEPEKSDGKSTAKKAATKSKAEPKSAKDSKAQSRTDYSANKKDKKADQPASDLFKEEAPEEALARLLDLVENAEDMDALSAILDDNDAVYQGLPQEQYDKFEAAYTGKHIEFSGT